ncbi:hypothetical protein QFC19_009295 [Naganishia cerealis]|uniref:Uncharacterized protein n=1 Tax=Naganishia cerealis TaxID=610337 RepID=A0ACC2UVB5_9TREE|nr:hypothetical protein QFC19_009295 [Naganishia cerealis]
MASPTKMTATASISRKSAFGATLATGDIGARSMSAGPGALERGLRSGTSGVAKRQSTRPATSEGIVMASEERRRSIQQMRTADRDSPGESISGAFLKSTNFWWDYVPSTERNRFPDSESAIRTPQPGSTGTSLQLEDHDIPPSSGPQQLPRVGALPVSVVSVPGSAGFTFGELVSSGSPSSVTRHSDTSSTNRSADLEAAEAERQRIAFMTSSYGRGTRGSLGRSGLTTGTPGSRRGSALREQIISASASSPDGKKVLLGNEGYRRGSLGIPGFDTSGLTAVSTSASTTGSAAGSLPPALGAQIGQGTSISSAASSHDGRRGSIPVTIPARRTPSTASEHIMESEDEDVS